jgi:signal transduction histidine kinase
MKLPEPSDAGGRGQVHFGRFVHYFQAMDRLFLLLLVLLAVGLALTLLHAFRNFRQQKIRAFSEEALYAVRLHQALMGSRLGILQNRIARLATDPNLAEMNPEGESSLIHFYDFLKTDDYIRAVSRVSPDMRLVFTIPDTGSMGADLSDQEHNQAIVRTRQPVFSSPFTAVQGYRTIAILHPVLAGGDYRGCVAVLVDFDKFARHFIGHVEVRGAGQVWVVDENGEFIFFPQGREKEREAVAAALQAGLMDELRKSGEGDVGYPRTTPEGTQERLLAFGRLKPQGGTAWYICLDAATEDVLATQPQFQLWESSILYPVLVFLLIAVGLILGYHRFAHAYARALREQLYQVQRMEMVTLFINGITHDFNNIVQVLGGFAELLKINHGHVGEEEMRVIEDLMRRAHSLTGQLLEFSYRRPPPKRTATTDLNATIREMVRMLRYILPGNVRIELELDDALLPLPIAQCQAEQVFMNLCLNARDAMPAGGTLTIATRLTQTDQCERVPATLRKGRCLLLTVADTGTGMPKHVRERIFDPFFTTKGENGTGLGLPTVGMIINDLHGDIVVESEEGRGSRFLVFIPVDSGG